MLTFNPQPFEFLPALGTWLLVLVAFTVVVAVFAFIGGLLTGGFAGVRRVFSGLVRGVVDLVSISPGRTWAITQLTFIEARRRKAFLVFVVFALVFMFAGWFLTGSEQRADEQVKVFVGFVLTTLSLLILPVALLLSCWGIPEDIRRRSLHTVVTKPVRRSEIVVGRMIGYVGINTIVLLVMGLVGYFWIVRQVPDEAKSALVSRVPIFGDLRFIDREGKPKREGVNVGDIWQHRSYIEGATPERAIFTFDGVTPDAMTSVVVKDPETGETREEERLRIESTFEAFRTYKGDMSRGIYVQYYFANPDDPEKTRVADPNAIFAIEEFKLNVQNIPRKIQVVDDETGAERTVDLFEDVVSDDGRLQVEVAALDGAQYLGMAKADLFIRKPDRPFASGYFKAVFGIWLMTVLVVVLGVTASTFAKGPIATLLTLTLLVIGSPFRGFMDELSNNYLASVTRSNVTLEGGGPLESIVRIVKHMNPTTELAPGVSTTVIQSVDHVFLAGLSLVRYVIPDFGVYNLSEYTSKGYDVFWSTDPGLLRAMAMTLAFLLPCILLGYYSLRFRELESK
ncbi:MAG: hypothetical protein M3552_20065 [Planctomycetota bacterium]|nr:hypothetical protein [Planctomycetaceae bacterium]MDQ3332913.1 hypothetical protein [Planctomycetota bacterium]